MPANEITSEGLQVQTLDEIIAELNAALKSIYGNDINLEQNSPDGQLVGILAQEKSDLLDVITQSYNSFNPDLAEGASLDARVAINGILRNAGTYTITPVSITVDRALNLTGLDTSPGSPFTVADASGNQFYLQTSTSLITAGTYVLVFRAKDLGAIQTQVNTITSMVTYIIGVTAINNPLSATTIGMDEESDASLKLRRQVSLAIASTNSLDSLQSNLLNVPLATDAIVWENYTSTSQIFTGVITGTPEIGATLEQATSGATATVAVIKDKYLLIDSIDGTFDFEHVVTGTNPANGTFTFTPIELISPHSIWPIIEGGEDADIAATIYAKRSAGCDMYGDEEETITRPNEETFDINFDRPSYQDLYLEFTLTAKQSGTSYDADQLKADIVAGIIYKLGQSAETASLTTLIASFVPLYTPTEVLLSKNGSNWYEIVSVLTPQEKFALTVGRITINT